MTTTTTTTTTTVTLSNVSSVYSGKDGKCCCGCAGKHTYASSHRDWASRNRGYAVGDEEVSDRTVKMMVNKINNAIAKGVIPEVQNDFVSVVVGERLYIAYLVH